VDHLSDQSDFHKYQFLYTPGLVINEQLVTAGRLPSALEIVAALEQHLEDKQE